MDMIDTSTGVVISEPRVRTKFNYDMDVVSYRTGSFNDVPTKTQQNMKEECDINTIVRRFGLTGQLPDNIRPPEYTDYHGVTDYHTAMNAVRAAAEEFMELPAHIRSEFRNDPQRYLEFFEKPENRARAVELGLVKRSVLDEVATPPAPSPAPVPAPAAPSTGA